MFDIAAIGEILVDFSCNDYQEGRISLTGSGGGATPNVLVQAAKLGNRTAFIGMVGRDLFGDFLKNELVRYGINTDGLVTTDEAGTTLAFVKTDENGERSFSFFRKPGADTLLKCSDINYGVIENSRVFQYGSVAMSREPCRSTVFDVLDRIKSHGIVLSYDPNLRHNLWDNTADMCRLSLEGMKYADILKLSEDELEFLTREDVTDKGVIKLQKQYDIGLVLVTRGKKGCRYYFGGKCGDRDGYDVTSVDTTGAGDAFLGAFLHRFLECGTIGSLDFDMIGEYVDFANAAGALSTTKKGTMSAMPLLEDIERFRRSAVTG